MTAGSVLTLKLDLRFCSVDWCFSLTSPKTYCIVLGAGDTSKVHKFYAHLYAMGDPLRY